MATLIATVIDTGLAGDYPSHNAAMADYYGASNPNLVAGNEYCICSCQATTGVLDTTGVTITGMTGNATHYVEVITALTDTGGDGVGGSYRHNGRFPTTGQKIYAHAVANVCILFQQNYTYLKGIAFRVGWTAGTLLSCVSTFPDKLWTDIAYCVFTMTQDAFTSAIVTGVNLDRTDAVRVYGNIFYDFVHPVRTPIALRIPSSTEASDVNYIFANTFINCEKAVTRDGTTSTVVMKNSVAFDCPVCYEGTFSTGTSHNAYSAGSDPGTDGLDISTFSGAQLFADYDDDDFTPNYAGPLMSAGEDISTDPNLPVTLDYKGNPRPTGLGYECGAIEAMPPEVIPGMLQAGNDVAELEDLLDKFSRETFRRMKRGSPLPPPVVDAQLPEPVTGAHLPPVVPDARNE